MSNLPIVVLTPHERVLLRAKTFCDEATIRAWARGDTVREASALRLTGAAAELGIVLSGHKPTP
jgi:hypothetical protein